MQGALEEVGVGGAGDVDVVDIGDGDGGGVLGGEGDEVVGLGVAFLDDAEVEATAAGLEEALDDVVAAEPDGEFVTGDTGFGDGEGCGADGVSIADSDGLFGHALGGEILTRHGEGDVHVGQFGAPEGVVFGRAGVDGLGGSAVDGEVGSLVAGEVVFADGDAMVDGAFEDAGFDEASLPGDGSGQGDVDRQQLHGGGSGDRRDPYEAMNSLPTLRARSAVSRLISRARPISTSRDHPAASWT